MKTAWMAGLVAMGILCAPGVKAANIYWNQNAGGAFLEDANWVDDGWNPAQVPTADDQVFFAPATAGGDANFTVTLGANHSISHLNYRHGAAGTITLDLGENTLEHVYAGTWGIRVTASHAGLGSRELVLSNGTLDLTSSSFRLGNTTDDDLVGRGILVVDDSATLNVAGNKIYVGDDSDGELRVKGTLSVGAVSSFTTHEVGYAQATGDGWLYVDGGTLTFDDSGSSQVLGLGLNGASAVMEVTNQGTVSGLRSIRVGFHTTLGGSASLLVDGAGSEVTVGDVSISRSDATNPTEGLVTIRNGGKITTGNRENSFGDRATLKIDGGEFVQDVGTGTSGTTWHAGSKYELTLHDKTDTPFLTNGSLALTTTDDGVTFELGDMAYGSYWADFVARDGATPFTGTMFDVLVYGAELNLDGTFADIDDNDTLIQTPDGQWEFVMHYAYSPTGGTEEDYRIALELVTIPEPQTLGLVLLGVAGVFLRRFRRG